MSWFEVRGRVVKGHGAASGRKGDPRFPEGTLALQAPLFEERGLDLSPFHQGTINVSIAPQRPIVKAPKYTFRNVKWSPETPPEDFSFFDCQVVYEGRVRDGLIYYPHPETKPEHFQDPHVLEVLAPFIEGLEGGDRMVLRLKEAQLGMAHE